MNSILDKTLKAEKCDNICIMAIRRIVVAKITQPYSSVEGKGINVLLAPKPQESRRRGLIWRNLKIILIY